MVSAYIIPAVFALLAKGWMLVLSFKSQRNQKYLTALVSVFFVLSIAECAVLLRFQSGNSADWIIRSYYVASVFCLSILCVYATSIAFNKHTKHATILFLSFAFVLSSLCLLTDFILSGSMPIEYSYTAERGDYYPVYSFFAIVSFLYATVVLVLGIFTSLDHKRSVQCCYTILALSPVVLSGIFIALAMNAGIKINAVGILPIATTLFLFFTLKSENSHNLSDIRRHLPFSQERELAKELLEIASEFSMDRISLKDFQEQTERAGVRHKFIKSGYSARKAAESAKINAGTYYAKLHKLGVWDESTSRSEGRRN